MVTYSKSFSNTLAVKDWDKERISLFYTLAIFEKTRRHIDDFKKDCIKVEGLKQDWQSERTIKGTKLAFNLFNNFHGLDSECENYSPLELFSLSTIYMDYMLIAVQIRFS
jgi:hypothetical protein